MMMTKISETLHIRCPYGRAKDFLREELAPFANTGKHEPRVLRVQVRGSELTAPVMMQYNAQSDPMGFDEPWAITWKPKEGLYPTFAGTLCVRADVNWDSGVLELQGEYEPPLGVAGAAFDAVIGKRIAEATAMTLLGDIAKTMESRYNTEEAMKAELRRETTNGSPQ
jgi:hypothetical protein